MIRKATAKDNAIQRRPRSALLRYSVAAVTVAVAASARLSLDPLLGEHGVFLPFTAAVIVSVYLCGRGPGLASAALGMLTAQYLFLEPRYSFALADTWDLIALLEFATVSVVIAELSGRLRDRLIDVAQSRRVAQALLDLSSQAIIATTDDGRIAVANSRADSMFGYAPGELLGQPHDSLIPERLRERHRQHYRDFLSHRRPQPMTVGMDLTGRRKDGTEFPVEITLDSFRSASEFLSVSFVTDISERRRMEDELRRQHDLMSTITGCAAEGLILVDREGRVDFANPAAEQMLGWTADELRGTVVHDRVHCQQADGTPLEWCDCPLEQVLATGKPIHGYEIVFFRRDGTPCPVSNSVAPIFVEGQIAGAVLVVSDITERKRAEEALRQSEQRVRRKLESILLPEGDTSALDLGDVLDVKSIQSLMDDFYRLAGIPVGLVDLKGNLLVAAGFQKACTRYHRLHPDTLENCLASDTQLSAGVAAGECKLYKCMNNMWDVVTPLMIGGEQIGNLFCGQFFFEDEEVDLEVFRSQAARYGFPEEEYVAAIQDAPRLSRKRVEDGVAYLSKVGQMISRLSYSNIKLARSLAERERLMTDLRAEQEKLRTSEERSRLATETTGLGTFDVDLHTDKIIWSALAKQQFGLPSDAEVNYQTYVGALHPDDREHVEAAIAAASRLSSGGRYSDEYRVIRVDDGRERWFSVWGQVFFDEQQRPARLIGVRRDITDRRQAEERLRDSESRLRTLGDNLPEGAIYRYRQDRNGEPQVEFISAGIERLTGVPAAEYMADMSTVLRHIVPADLERLNAAIVQSREQLTRFEVEVRHKHRVTGETRWCLMRSTPTRQPDGSTVWDGIELDITERKRAEEAMRAHQQTLLRFIQAAPVAIAMFDLEMRYLAVSQRYLDDYNLGPQELEGRSHYEVFPEATEEWREVHRRCLAGSIEQNPGELFGRADGGQQWLRWAIQPWRQEDGAIGGLILFSEDITLQRLAEREVAASEERFRALVTATCDVVYRMNPDWSEMRQLSGRGFIADTEAPRRNWLREYIHPDDQPRVLEVIREAIRTKSIFELEHKVLRVDGSLGWTFSRAIPLLNANGEIIEWFGAASDITQRKVAEEALLASEEQFRTLANAIPQLCWMANADGWIFWYNDRWYDYTGTTPEQMEGWGWQSVHDPDALPSVLERWKASLATAEPFDMVFPLRGRDGVFRPFLTLVMPVRARDGKVTRWFGTNTDISEQRRIEEALRESERRYRALFESMQQVFVVAETICDQDGKPADWRYLDVNPAFESVFGRPRAEVVGRTSREVFPDVPAWECWVSVLGEVGLTGCPAHLTQCVSGDRQFEAIAYSPDAGQFAAVFTDVTERKRAEAALQRSEERFRVLFESMDEGFAACEMICDAAGQPVDFRYLLVNSAFTRITGLPADQVVGRTVRDAIPAIEPFWIETYGRVARTGMSERVEHPVAALGVWLEVFAWCPWPGQFAALFYDTTEKRLTGQALRRLSELVDLSHDAIITADVHRVIRTWNAGAVELYGWTEAEAVGQAIHQLLQTQGPVTMPQLDDVLQRKGRWDGELAHIAKDGTPLWVESCQVLDSTGGAAAILEINRDITARKRAEESLQRANEQLEQRVRGRTLQLEAANAELEAFAYSVSHHLRAPLRGIDGWSLALLEDYRDRLDDGGRKQLAWVRAEAQRMGGMIEDLLQLSRVTRGSMQQVQVDLTALAHAVARRLSQAAPDRSVVFQIQPGLSAWGDARLLEIALDNLLDNAVKYTSPRAEARIEVGRTSSSEAGAFYVRDNGVGFDPKCADTLFTAFQRLHKPSEFPGTGIGLATVQRIIQRHGGRLRAEAVPGEGATFYFTLPAAESAPTEIQ